MAESFLDAGIAHFTPAHKTEKENGNYIWFHTIAEYEFIFTLPTELAHQIQTIAKDLFINKHPGMTMTQSAISNGRVSVFLL